MKAGIPLIHQMSLRLRESPRIVGWVAMRRPIQIFLHECWPSAHVACDVV